jgi:hypothetical protein
MKKIVIFTLGILMGVNAFAQTPAARPMTAPAPAMDVQLSNTLAQLEQAAQDTHAALGKMRVDKWKTDSSVKKQYQGNVESLQRNLSAALPELTGRVRQAPQDSNANFKLYRNVNTLYDVLANVVETAGAFGPKDQYEALAQQVGMLDQIRRTLGDRLDQLTSSKESELGRLHSQMAAISQAQAAAPPKKIVVDDNEPAKPKKPKAKKPTATKPATAAGTPTPQ